MASSLFRVSLLGNMPNGEVWSVNPVYRINAPEVVTYSDVLAAVNAINAIVIPTGVRNMQSAAVTHTGCRVEARAADGTLEALAEGARSAPVTGQGNSNGPFQSAIVSSLRTPGPGASARGRLYWPANGVGLDAATLRISAANVTSFQSGVKTYLAAISAALDNVVDSDVILAVWSRKLSTTFGVTRMMMGDIVDTQRRRRDSLAETYQEVVYP